MTFSIFLISQYIAGDKNILDAPFLFNRNLSAEINAFVFVCEIYIDDDHNFLYICSRALNFLVLLQH
jgi:hypothetical protein